MRLSSLLAACVLATTALSDGAGQVVVIGDSLSKEYEFSFRLDGFFDPDSVRNWAEILHAERNEFFDLGSRRDVSVLFVDIFFRHQYNWAVPGSKLPQISAFLRGEIGFPEFYTSSDPSAFESVINAIALFLTDDDFDPGDLDFQIRHTAERVVLLAGGNDADEVYREIYEADPTFDAAAWTAGFLREAEFVMDWVLERNPDIQFLVVALPHVGITPNVKASHPPDPAKTARVTDVMRELNRQLAAAARDRGIAFADIFDPMLRLLEPSPACLHGIPFINDIPPVGTDPGDLDYLWLNGTASDGFHPNTNAQAVVANEILRAFNDHYGLGVPLLTATEMLHDWLGKDPDVPYAEWRDCYGLAGAPPNHDGDLDGMPLALEFGVGADPTRHDPWHLAFSIGEEGGLPFLELAYPLRLPSTSHVLVQPETSVDLSHWLPIATPAAPESDGRFHVRLPREAAAGFLRLRATVSPPP